MEPSLSTSDLLLLPLRLVLLLVQILLCYLEFFFKALVPSSPKDVKGKVVLVTGAGMGIGRAIALKFAALGARVALWDINEAACQETLTLIQNDGGSGASYSCDVSSREDVRRAAREVQVQMGPVDIVVNNAGVLVCKPFLDLSETEVRRGFDINTMAHYWVLQEVLPSMLERDEGHVVSIISMAGRTAARNLSEYCGSKFGAVGVLECVKEEVRWKTKNIKFTGVYPMFTNTKLIGNVSDRIYVANKFGVMLEPATVAEAVVDGVRRNKHNVYVPGHMAVAVILTRLLPRRAEEILSDFMDTGFRLRQNQQ